MVTLGEYRRQPDFGCSIDEEYNSWFISSVTRIPCESGGSRPEGSRIRTRPEPTHAGSRRREVKKETRPSASDTWPGGFQDDTYRI
jgi:hypothetical protein